MSDGGVLGQGAAGTVLDALNNASTAKPAQVGISTGAFLALALFTLFSFNLLRPNNKIVYCPKLKYAEDSKRPPSVGDGFFSWVTPLIKYKENDLLPILGLDAIAFLRFLRMIRNLTIILAIMMSVILIPIDLTFYLSDSGKAYKVTGLALITMSQVQGARIWAHVAMSYVGTGVCLYFIWTNYRVMLRLRWAYFRSEEYQKSFHSRTLMITGVQKRLQSDPALAAVLSEIKLPYPTTEVHIGREVGSLPDLIEKHEDLVRKLERVLAKYLKDPNNVSATRPTVSIGGFMGCGGKRVDAIDHWTNQINKVEAAIESWRERIAEKKPESYGFASLAAVPFAHAAAKSLKKKHPKGLTIQLAPTPRDIIWRNLTLTKGQRFKSSTWGFFLLSLLLFVNAVPLLAVALITQMSSFTGYLGFLKSWQDSSYYTFAAVAGLAPPIISGLAGWLLPIMMRRLAAYRGAKTKNQRDHVVLSQYFGFLVISQFVVFTLIGVALSTIGSLISEVQANTPISEIFEKLRSETLGLVKGQYFNMSNYWLTWIPLRGYLAIFDLAQVIKLLLVWVQKGFLGRTPRDVREYTKPPAFDYSIYYANLLFLFAVCMLYAVLAPLVLIFGGLAFTMSAIVYKYQLMFVSVTKNESGGALWRVVVNRLFVCIIFMQLILALVIALDQTALKAIVSLPPVLAVIGFKIYCNKTFDQKFNWYIPDGEEIAESHIHAGDSRHNRLQRRFGHPALHQPLFTPMVHAKVKHLLPKVYSGKLESTGMTTVDGRKVETEEVMGGMKIAAIEEDQLEYDPRTDSDVRSIMSGTTMGGMIASGPGTPRTMAGVGSRQGTMDPFHNQYQNYLAGGPGSRSDVNLTGNAAPMALHSTNSRGDVYEMNDVKRIDSRENLLDRNGMSIYSDNDTLLGSGGHGRKVSNDLLYKTQNFASPQSTPGFEGAGSYFVAPPNGNQAPSQNQIRSSPQSNPQMFRGNPNQNAPYGHGPPSRSGTGYSDYGQPPPSLPPMHHQNISQASLGSLNAANFYDQAATPPVPSNNRPFAPSRQDSYQTAPTPNSYHSSPRQMNASPAGLPPQQAGAYQNYPTQSHQPQGGGHPQQGSYSSQQQQQQSRGPYQGYDRRQGTGGSGYQ